MIVNMKNTRVASLSYSHKEYSSQNLQGSSNIAIKKKLDSQSREFLKECGIPNLKASKKPKNKVEIIVNGVVFLKKKPSTKKRQVMKTKGLEEFTQYQLKNGKRKNTPKGERAIINENIRRADIKSAKILETMIPYKGGWIAKPKAEVK